MVLCHSGSEYLGRSDECRLAVMLLMEVSFLLLSYQFIKRVDRVLNEGTFLIRSIKFCIFMESWGKVGTCVENSNIQLFLIPGNKKHVRL